MYKENFYTDDLENEVEEIVFEELYFIIKEEKVKFCQCDICIQDIAAIVLNTIPPRYKSNLFDKKNPRGEEKKQLEKIRNDARNIILKAIAKVNNKPHH